ncbi:hypothetical protein U0070_025093, partial [Myodes glareolus]
MKDVQAHVSLVSDDFLKRELALMQGLRMGRLLLEIQGHQPSGDSSVLLEWTLPPFPFSASFRVGSVLRISKEAGLAASRSSHRNQRRSKKGISEKVTTAWFFFCDEAATMQANVQHCDQESRTLWHLEDSPLDVASKNLLRAGNCAKWNNFAGRLPEGEYTGAFLYMRKEDGTGISKYLRAMKLELTIIHYENVWSCSSQAPVTDLWRAEGTTELAEELALRNESTTLDTVYTYIPYKEPLRKTFICLCSLLKPGINHTEIGPDSRFTRSSSGAHSSQTLGGKDLSNSTATVVQPASGRISLLHLGHKSMRSSLALKESCPFPDSPIQPLPRNPSHSQKQTCTKSYKPSPTASFMRQIGKE